jgi:hypothetical protein
VENVTLGLADCPEAILAVTPAGIFPDQHRSREDARAIVETDTAFTQRPHVLAASHSNPS